MTLGGMQLTEKERAVVVEAISKQRMCICALNLVDVVDGLTSARVMVRDLIPLKEATVEEKKEAA